MDENDIRTGCQAQIDCRDVKRAYILVKSTQRDRDNRESIDILRAK